MRTSSTIVANKSHSGCRSGRWRVAPIRVATAIAAVATASLAGARYAAADADLIETYSPVVQPGILELEARGHGSVGLPKGNADAQAELYETGYGVTNWCNVALLGATQQAPHAGPVLSAVGIETIFQLAAQGEYFVDPGLYFEYTKGVESGVPQDAEAKILLQKSYGRTNILLNVAVDKSFGRFSKSGVGSSYSFEVNRPVFRNSFISGYVGVQAYGETGTLGPFVPFDRQSHSFGPVFGGHVRIAKLPGALEYEAGYLFGITPASARGTPKLVLEYEIPF